MPASTRDQSWTGMVRSSLKMSVSPSYSTAQQGQADLTGWHRFPIRAHQRASGLASRRVYPGGFRKNSQLRSRWNGRLTQGIVTDLILQANRSIQVAT